MQHIGDLQPLAPPDYLADRAPVGRYSAKRSRWRFAVGSLEVGFDRASEQIQAETPRIVRESRRPDFGQRLLILVGMLATSALVLAVAGWLWSTRGISAFSGDTVSASIVDRGGPDERGGAAQATRNPTVIPTEQPPARLAAVIEQRKPAPAMAPAARAAVPIADGKAIEPRAAVPEVGKIAPPPDEAIVSSGNFLLIPTVARAVSLAMASGDAQSWAAGRYHGLVVVGDADRRDGQACRQGTVLLRDGSVDGRTQKFERCVPAASARKG